MVKEAQTYMNKKKKEQISSFRIQNNKRTNCHEILMYDLEYEKVCIKDAKLRTLLHQTVEEMTCTHVYDISYGSVKTDDTSFIIG